MHLPPQESPTPELKQPPLPMTPGDDERSTARLQAIPPDTIPSDLSTTSEAEDMCIDPASAATITRVLAYSARTFPLDCDVYLERFSLCDSC